MPLHHDPSQGGDEEEKKYNQQYHQTRASYEVFFGYPPPKDIWGGREEINNSKSSFLDKLHISQSLSLMLMEIILIFTLTGCQNNPLELQGPEFLSLYVAIGTLDLICAVMLKWFISGLEIDKKYTLERWIPALLMFGLTGLGIGKISIGISRGKPVGILLFLCQITGIIGFVFLDCGGGGSSCGGGGGCGSGCGGGGGCGSSCGGGGGCGGCGGG